jgi:hypothetical protein
LNVAQAKVVEAARVRSRGMRHMIESGVARVGAALQSLGTHMDYDVMSLPGGSVIAVVLALYGSAMDSMTHDHPRPSEEDIGAAAKN